MSGTEPYPDAHRHSGSFRTAVGMVPRILLDDGIAFDTDEHHILAVYHRFRHTALQLTNKVGS